MNPALALVAQSGLCSPLACRVLDAALTLGHNVLFTGKKTAALPLMQALIGDDPVPTAVAQLCHNPDSDRTAAWDMPAREVAMALTTGTGVVGYLSAGRLDRALMRFELLQPPHVSAALAVLASIDLVVVMAAVPTQAAVAAIYELRLSDEGYRPVLLFGPGAEPFAQLLVPQALPSIVTELTALGEPALAAELRAAVGLTTQPSAPPSAPAAAVNPPAQGAKTRSQPRNDGPHAGLQGDFEPQPRRKMPARAAASAPGWELDRLGPALPPTGDDLAAEQPPAQPEGEQASLAAQRSAAPSAVPEAAAVGAEPESSSDAMPAADTEAHDHAALAAAYGLAPPPRPKGA